MNDIFYIIDNGLCFIGAISLLLAIISAFKLETSTYDDNKKMLKSTKYYNTYKITLICSIIAVLSYVLFGVSMYIQICMW